MKPLAERIFDALNAKGAQLGNASIPIIAAEIAPVRQFLAAHTNGGHDSMTTLATKALALIDGTPAADEKAES